MGLKEEIDKHLDADEGLRNRESLNRINEPASPAVQQALTLLDKLAYAISLVVMLATVLYSQFSTLPAMNAVIEKGGANTFTVKTGKSAGQTKEIGGAELIQLRDHVQLKRNILVYAILFIAPCLGLIFFWQKQFLLSLVASFGIIGGHVFGIIQMSGLTYFDGAYSIIDFGQFASYIPLALLAFQLFNPSTKSKPT